MLIPKQHETHWFTLKYYNYQLNVICFYFWNVEILRLDFLNDCFKLAQFPFWSMPEENWNMKSISLHSVISCCDKSTRVLILSCFPESLLSPSLQKQASSHPRSVIYGKPQRFPCLRDNFQLSLWKCTLWISSIIAPQYSRFLLSCFQLAQTGNI